MHTLLIPPSFMAVFAVAIFSVGWLIMTVGDTAVPDYTAQPPRDSFFSWSDHLPFEKSEKARIPERVRERLDEIGQF